VSSSPKTVFLSYASQDAEAAQHICDALLAQGRGEEARDEVLREPEEWARLWALGNIQHATGRPAESEAALHELIAKYATKAAYQVATVYAARGEPDLAFDWLERAYDQRDPGLAEIQPERSLRSLHADSRWEAFLRTMKLEDQVERRCSVRWQLVAA